jgi:hypothetical protein
MEYLYNVQFGFIISTDPELPKKIKQFIGKGVIEERQDLIDALKSIGFEGDDNLWDLYTLEELKIEFKRIKK